MINQKEIIKAYVWVRENNNTIPIDVLIYMKDCALYDLLGGQKILLKNFCDMLIKSGYLEIEEEEKNKMINLFA